MSIFCSLVTEDCNIFYSQSTVKTLESASQLPYRYKEGGGKEKVCDHSLYQVLHDEPNPEMTSFVFRETLMSHLLIWGNAYAQIIRDGAGRVLGLYPLLPNKMDVQRDDKGEMLRDYKGHVTVKIDGLAASAASVIAVAGDRSYQ